MILRKKIAGTGREALERFAVRARRALRLRGEVNVLVTGSAELRRLNWAFRGKDRPTDVLSFPSGHRGLPPQRAKTGRAGDPGLVGDIAISADIARANARELGHSASDEIKVLLLHGLLHLAGYDHEKDGGRMARREERMRRELGLPVALLRRNAGAAPARRKR